MPNPTPSAGARWRENKLLSTDRGEEALSLKHGEHGADATSRHGLGSNPITTRGDKHVLMIGCFSFSFSFSWGENSCWDKLPELN